MAELWGSLHPTLQVSQTSWNADDPTQLSGGFSFTSGTSGAINITAGMAGSTIYYLCSNHVFSGMKGTISVNVTSSVSDNRLLDYNFTVFPNPVRGISQLNISTKKRTPVIITLFDGNGRMMRQLYYMQMQPGEITLPFSAVALSKGTYYLFMRTNEGTLQKRVLIY